MESLIEAIPQHRNIPKKLVMVKCPGCDTIGGNMLVPITVEENEIELLCPGCEDFGTKED